jgi:hypothetical protein
MFTDNFVSENEFYRGASTSPILFALVLGLHLMEMHCGWKLHVIHVTGKRTIQQGMDGLSWGDIMPGVEGVTGPDMLFHAVECHQSDAVGFILKSCQDDLVEKRP